MAYSTNEMMTVAAARRLKNGSVCFVGIGLPSKAANLARLTSSPDVVLIYESGPIGAKPSVLPLSIGDGELAETADTVVPTGEIFRYWLQGGRIDVGFLGAAQVDRFGNINTTVVGDYHRPKVRLPGAGGAPGDRRLGQERTDHTQAVFAFVCRQAGFHYLRRPRRRRRFTQAPGPAGSRSCRDYYRPVHHGAGGGHP